MNMHSSAGNKVLVIGLDCADPDLLFEKWIDELPNIRSLLERGTHGRLRSCDPPITVPAWAVMMSSRCPGSLGIYGFRNRSSHAYDRLKIASSRDVKVDRIWDILSQAGKRVVVMGVPLTYPVCSVNGLMISDFLTPNTDCEYTYPTSLSREIKEVVGDYVLDVRDFRSENKEQILKDIYEMTRKRFKLMRHFIQHKQWDFFMMVEMGTDRIHHAFWSYMDTAHRSHEAGHSFEHAIRDYYHLVDREIGETLELIDDQTTVFIVSDHGAKRMDGGICINDWLINEGYLTLLERPSGVTPIGKTQIDWSRTVAWSDGGYYARVFINLKGREPQGAVAPANYEKVRAELTRKIRGIPDHLGQPLDTKVHRPEELYAKVEGIAPDLLVYFDNLFWRSIGSVGHEGIHSFDNDTGPDDANHGQEGIILAAPSSRVSFATSPDRILRGANLLDIAPTILEILGEPIPAAMEGHSLCVGRDSSGQVLPPSRRSFTGHAVAAA